MDEQKLEYLLHDALVLAAAERYKTVPDIVPVFSNKYQRKFSHMLKKPFEYAKGYRRTIGNRIGRLALVAILILAIMGAGIFVMPQTRGVAVDIIRQWFEDHVTFSFSENAENYVLSEYKVSYLPEGYELLFEDGEEGLYQIWQFENENKDVLCVEIFVKGEYFSTSIDTEYCTPSLIELENNIDAQLFKADSPDGPSTLVWMSEDNNVFYCIWGKLSTDELVNIANGLVEK